MAIIIPSKDIYEINNQKVVDNEVDNVEVGAKNVVQDNHYSETVYNENVEEGFYSDSEIVISTNHDLFASIIPQTNQRMPFYACSVCANAQYYLNKTIYIPFVIDNTHILNGILTGVDKNGNTNISYSCSGKIINGRTSTGITVIIQANTYIVENAISVFAPPSIEEGYIVETEEDGAYTIPNEETNNYSDSNYTVETKITIARKDNLSSVKAEKVIIDSKEYLKVDLTGILCGIRIIKSSGEGTAFPTENYKPLIGTGTLSGSVSNTTYVQYIPKQVSITIYGNTLGINLEDETVKIGDGQHVYSFSGNELMQTSNKKTTLCMVSVGDFIRSNGEDFSVYSVTQSYPAIHSGDVLIYNGEKAYCISTSPAQISVQNNGEWAKMSNVHISFTSYKEEGSQIENYYKNVISQWQNGKEIATIKCGMVDYYQSAKQTNSIQVYKVGNISSKRCSISGTLTSAMPNKNSLIGVYMTISGNTYKMYNISLANNNTDITGEIDLSYRDVPLQQHELSYEYMDTTPAISVKETGLPMTINIGDTVIPYIKGADGSDKPMSYYMDRTTPKEFLVIGKGITADGEILQELTLQEVTQN